MIPSATDESFNKQELEYATEVMFIGDVSELSLVTLQYQNERWVIDQKPYNKFRSRLRKLENLPGRVAGSAG